MPSAAFARVSLISAVGTYLLILMGAIVRVTGSGLGCPDWPLCHGQWLPPLEYHAVLEYVHRTVAAIIGVPLLLMLALGFRRGNADRWTRAALIAMFVLLVPQVLLGREVVLRELPPFLVAIHLAIALIILALVIFVAVSAQRAIGAIAAGEVPTGLTAVAAGMYAVLMSGALMRAMGASWVCRGFPLCDGAWPFGDPLVDAHMTHRALAILVGVAVIGVTFALRARLVSRPGAFVWLRLSCLFVMLQIGVGIAQVVQPAEILQILHVAGGSAIWAALIAAMALLARSPRTYRT
ncbi:MAG: heme A synthase [Chloroflexi bacterium]|nr:heme A synthase [Chloroflexota bacterium]